VANHRLQPSGGSGRPSWQAVWPPPVESCRSSAKESMLRTPFPNGRFSPPATEAAIVDAESQLGVQLPSQLRALYLICDGFREDKGNAKYLFSLTDEDFIGSLVSITKHMWAEWKTPDLRPFLFFGSSSGDDCWGINHIPSRALTTTLAVRLPASQEPARTLRRSSSTRRNRRALRWRRSSSHAHRSFGPNGSVWRIARRERARLRA